MSAEQPRLRVDALDPVSRNLLPVLRHFLLVLQGEKPQGWRQAYTIAAEIWGEARGLAIAHRAQAFLSALLQSRPGPIASADPLCLTARQDVTEDEQLVLMLLTYMRLDQTPLAREILASLTGGRIEAACVRTGLTLCAVLDGDTVARRDKPVCGATRPALRVVS